MDGHVLAHRDDITANTVRDAPSATPKHYTAAGWRLASEHGVLYRPDPNSDAI
ncbi:MAG: hypothetical protein FWE61_01415 [Micrococcales bacterium]|nr:hypothetical protein [Micrococcales bacterium]